MWMSKPGVLRPAITLDLHENLFLTLCSPEEEPVVARVHKCYVVLILLLLV